MKNLINLGDVFKRNATYLYDRADAGFPFSVLISDAGRQEERPACFQTEEEADAHLESLCKQGLDAAVAKTTPNSRTRDLDYRLYIKPRTGFGSFDYNR